MNTVPAFSAAMPLRLSDLVSEAIVVIDPPDEVDTSGPVSIIAPMERHDALRLWQGYRAALIDHRATLKPRSKEACLCDHRLRVATLAVMALEVRV